MRASAMVAFAVLLLQFLFLAQCSRTLAGKEPVGEEDSAGSTRARKPISPSHGASRGARLLKAAGEAGDGGGDGIHRRAGSTSQLGTSKKTDAKRQTLPLSPPKSKSQGLQEHLKGHGKFNADTVSNVQLLQPLSSPVVSISII